MSFIVACRPGMKAMLTNHCHLTCLPSVSLNKSSHTTAQSGEKIKDFLIIVYTELFSTRMNPYSLPRASSISLDESSHDAAQSGEKLLLSMAYC